MYLQLIGAMWPQNPFWTQLVAATHGWSKVLALHCDIGQRAVLECCVSARCWHCVATLIRERCWNAVSAQSTTRCYLEGQSIGMDHKKKRKKGWVCRGVVSRVYWLCWLLCMSIEAAHAISCSCSSQGRVLLPIWRKTCTCFGWSSLSYG